MKKGWFAISVLLSVVGALLVYSGIYRHIEATAHSNPVGAATWFLLITGLALTTAAIRFAWPTVKGFAILTTLGIQAVCFVICLGVFWLPFP